MFEEDTDRLVVSLHGRPVEWGVVVEVHVVHAGLVLEEQTATVCAVAERSPVEWGVAVDVDGVGVRTGG